MEIQGNISLGSGPYGSVSVVGQTAENAPTARNVHEEAAVQGDRVTVSQDALLLTKHVVRPRTLLMCVLTRLNPCVSRWPMAPTSLTADLLPKIWCVKNRGFFNSKFLCGRLTKGRSAYGLSGPL